LNQQNTVLFNFLCSCVVYCAYDMDAVSAINHHY